jgi:hypothetical protein
MKPPGAVQWRVCSVLERVSQTKTTNGLNCSDARLLQRNAVAWVAAPITCPGSEYLALIVSGWPQPQPVTGQFAKQCLSFEQRLKFVLVAATYLLGPVQTITELVYARLTADGNSKLSARAPGLPS